jgi:HJR/Mrr/RecB family endonuclease
LSRKNQLLCRDWRSLQGTKFEAFLVEVFEYLGYSVQTTKASGDQGVDLIAVKGGRSLAVQAKGYEKSVGNAAVQEVVAGMQYYKCGECMVITNSVFTRGAYDLARETGCLLVDGERIPSLIEGAIF